MNEERQNEGVHLPRKINVHIMGAILLAAILASVFIGGPLGVILYVAGLFNSIGIMFIAFLLVLLSPVVVVCLAGLGIFLYRKVSRPGLRWLCVLITATCMATLAPTGLYLCGVELQPPIVMQIHGFHRYAQIKTDISAIQAWLGTLDPNNCKEQFLYDTFDPTMTSVDQSEFIPSPPCLACFHSNRPKLLLDDAGRPMIRFLWGGGLAGHWGIVVGDPNMEMEIPKKEDSGLIERRMPLAPGAYTWFRE